MKTGGWTIRAVDLLFGEIDDTKEIPKTTKGVFFMDLVLKMEICQRTGSFAATKNVTELKMHLKLMSYCLVFQTTRIIATCLFRREKQLDGVFFLDTVSFAVARGQQVNFVLCEVRNKRTRCCLMSFGVQARSYSAHHGFCVLHPT